MKQYNTVKNATYTVISFTNNKRTLTIGNCDIIRAVEEMQRLQKNNDKVIILDDSKVIIPDKCNWNYEYYIQFI